MIDIIPQPYTHWTCKFDAETEWYSRVDGRIIPTMLRSDPLGFLSYFDYELPATPLFLETYGKLPGDRIVLLTGGSVTHGVGATSNRRSIAGQMECYLNDMQNSFHYRVINLGMTGWSAYQQAIGLDLWGTPFDPDWVVVMNGAHDAMAVLQQGGRQAVSPLLWPATGNRHEAHAKLWGPLLPPLRLRRRGLPPFSTRHATREEVGMALPRHFSSYVNAQKAISNRFPSAKYILGVQPWSNLPEWSPGGRDPFPTYWTTFAARDRKVHHEALLQLHQDLATWSEAFHAETDTIGRMAAQEFIQWFLIRSAFENIVSLPPGQMDGHPRISHLNANSVLPESAESRRSLFIDPIHLSDAGQEIIARFFARHILESDGLV